MRKYSEGEPLDLLQSPLKDDVDVIAISYAIKKATAKLILYSSRILMYAAIESQPEEILDYMAVEMNLAFYEQTFAIELKRNLIKSALLWYMSAGTRGAVENMITTIFGEGTITEWYEHETQGEPGTFDIQTEAQLTPELYDQMAKVIERVKNESSHMRYVSVLREIETEWQARFASNAANHYSATNDVIIDNPNSPEFGEVYVAIAEYADAECFSMMDLPTYTVDVNEKLYAHMGLSQFSTMNLVETIDPAEHSITAQAPVGLTQINKLTIGG